MVNTQHIIHIESIPETAHPPVKAGASMIIPVVKWISPQLACSRKAIWRTASYSQRLTLLIQLKQLWMGPGIGTVHSYIDRNITNDFHALAVGISLQLLPLSSKEILHEHLELNIKIQFLAVVVHGIAPAETNILWPFIPALALKSVLQSHEESIVFQPPAIVSQILLKILILTDAALLIGLAQKLVTAFVQLGIVNIISFFAHVHSLDFLFSQKACFHQLV